MVEKKSIPNQVIGFPVIKPSIAYSAQRSPPSRFLSSSAIQLHGPPTSLDDSPKSRPGKIESVVRRVNRLGEKVDNLAHDICEHVRLSPKITETVKGKPRLGARILQVGGLGRVFKQIFNVSREGEKLLKASQCYSSTTAGRPIAGLLFISTDKVAFCSERSIKLSSPTGTLLHVHYKVLIPLRKIMTANEIKNVKSRM